MRVETPHLNFLTTACVAGGSPQFRGLSGLATGTAFGHVFVATQQGFLTVIDVSDPRDPELTLVATMPGRPMRVYVQPPYLYLADLRGGLLICELQLGPR